MNQMKQFNITSTKTTSANAILANTVNTRSSTVRVLERTSAIAAYARGIALMLMCSMAALTLNEKHASANDIATQRVTPQPRFFLNGISEQPPGTTSSDRYIAGGLLGTIVGFGFGHMVNGTWHNTGWIFTLSQSVSLTMMSLGLATALTGENFGEKMMYAGMIGHLVSRVGETIDVWARPKVYNVTELVPVPNSPVPRAQLSPWFAPGSAGISGRLSF